MVRQIDYIPQHCCHKPSGQGYVRLNGKTLFTGRWNSPESKQKYNDLIRGWLANGRRLPGENGGDRPITVSDLVAHYWRFAETYYIKDNKPSRELVNIRVALRELVASYGESPAEKFRPLALKDVREQILENKKLSRKVINQRIAIIRRVFKWGVEQELLPGDAAYALMAVRPLQRGRSTAREPKAIPPVAEADVFAVLPFVSKQIAAMIMLQWHTGMRSGEVIQMRMNNIDRSRDVWEYRPTSHKTAHYNKDRVIFLGSKAQDILKPFLKFDAEAYLFSPKEAEADRRVRNRAARKSKLTPSQKRRDDRNARRRLRKLKDRKSVV